MAARRGPAGSAPSRCRPGPGSNQRVTSAGANVVGISELPINGVTYRNSLVLDRTKDSGFVECTLGRQCSSFEATFGLSDRTETGGQGSIRVTERRRRGLRPHLQPR